MEEWLIKNMSDLFSEMIILYNFQKNKMHHSIKWKLFRIQLNKRKIILIIILGLDKFHNKLIMKIQLANKNKTRIFIQIIKNNQHK